MKQYSKSIFVLITGLSFFHLFSIIQVYLSNLDLLNTLNSIVDEGYLLMPNKFIMAGLDDFSVAFAGGVFFTLSVGTFTVLVSFIIAVFYFQYDKTRKYLVLFSAIMLGLLLIKINLGGFCLVETASFFFVPIAVFFLYKVIFANDKDKPDIGSFANHFIPVIILAAFLALSTMGSSNKIFSDFRDNFLMSNKAGMKINDFYYDYTLYPARVFKPYSQRIPKISAIEAEKKTALVKLIEKRLIQKDYLVADISTKPDFIVKPDFLLKEKSGLSFIYKGKTILETSVSKFTSNPGKFLKEFSEKTDKYKFYRKITSLSLKTGFPLFMYILMHFTFFIFLRLLFSLLNHSYDRSSQQSMKVSPPRSNDLVDFHVKQTKASLFASLSCLAIGTLGFYFIFSATSHDVNINNLSSMLISADKGQKIAGLKFIAENQLDISKYAKYDTAFLDNDVLEKYWFARGSGTNSDPFSYDKLIELTYDPHPNVACQAFYGLGKKGEKEAISQIIEGIKRSKDWYVQWYAYQALKRLQWKQKRLN